MGSEKKSNQTKSKTDEKNAENKGMIVTCSRFFIEVSKTLHLEATSIAGRVNIVFDLALFLILIIYLLTSTVSSVTRIIASIINQNLTNQTGDNIVTLSLIFVVASALCLLFMHITRKEKEYYNQSIEEKIEE